MAIAKAARDAERTVAARCQAWGFVVTKIPEAGEREMRSDFRITQDSEAWIVEVKSRHGDSRKDEAVLNGQMVSYESSPSDDPSNRFHPVNAFRKAARQITSTRKADDLAAVWFVLGKNPSDELDPDMLMSTLLGSRTLVDFSTLKRIELYGVYEPEFGADVDALVLEREYGGMIALNPWSSRLERVRGSALVARFPKVGVYDPRMALDAKTAVMAPSITEARRLAHQLLERKGRVDDVDKFEGRRRREWQVSLALQELGFPPMIDDRFIGYRSIVCDK